MEQAPISPGRSPSEEADAARLGRLLQASHACILVQTLDEAYANEVLRHATLGQRLQLKAWKNSRGVYDADFADGAAVPDTEPAAAALNHLLGADLDRTAVILYDIVEHLSEPRPVRLLRDLIEKLRKKGGAVVLVDSRGDLPPAIDHEATRFEISLPDEKALAELVKDVLARERGRLKGPVRLTPSLWTQFLHHLRGLTRRQARQVVLDVISDDGELDEKDLPRVLARKRQILQKEGLLEFVETPSTLDEIAGMERLKTWL